MPEYQPEGCNDAPDYTEYEYTITGDTSPIRLGVRLLLCDSQFGDGRQAERGGIIPGQPAAIPGIRYLGSVVTFDERDFRNTSPIISFVYQDGPAVSDAEDVEGAEDHVLDHTVHEVAIIWTAMGCLRHPQSVDDFKNDPEEYFIGVPIGTYDTHRHELTVRPDALSASLEHGHYPYSAIDTAPHLTIIDPQET